MCMYVCVCVCVCACVRVFRECVCGSVSIRVCTRHMGSGERKYQATTTVVSLITTVPR